MAKRSEDDLLSAFDAGDDMNDFFDFEQAANPNFATRKVNVDMPIWMINALDKEAARLSINRQAVIKGMLDRQLRGIA